MPETAAAQPADSDCTDFSTMDDRGVEVVVDPAAQARLRCGEAGRLAVGVRLIFRAALALDGASQSEPRVGVDTRESGRIGFLAPEVARRYLSVLNELQRAGRVCSCAGYLVRASDGSVEARLLVHEPYECLRRIEADLLEIAARRREPRSA
jgi:hypothetical protein